MAVASEDAPPPGADALRTMRQVVLEARLGKVIVSHPLAQESVVLVKTLFVVNALATYVIPGTVETLRITLSFVTRVVKLGGAAIWATEKPEDEADTVV